MQFQHSRARPSPARPPSSTVQVDLVTRGLTAAGRRECRTPHLLAAVDPA